MKKTEASFLDLQFFDDFLKAHLAEREKELPDSAVVLKESIRYSLFSGGKRFRPQLSFLAAEIFDLPVHRVAPFAAAVELIHTYSLMHDDLPAMDNDDLRRGQPTNHKVFGEDIALLGGDALLTEAFYILAQYYSQQPAVVARLVALLSRAAGYTGMVAGQVIDMHFVAGKGLNPAHKTSSAPSMDSILRMHQLKTGALIQVSLEGVAVIAEAEQGAGSASAGTHAMASHSAGTQFARPFSTAQKALAQCGEHLGLAFQLADDLLDYDPNHLEASGWPKLLGVEKTREWLQQSTQNAIGALAPFGDRARRLCELVLSNQSRLK